MQISAERMAFRLTLITLLLTTPIAAQRPELSFELADARKRGEGKVMTRADFPAKYLLLIYQGVP